MQSAHSELQKMNWDYMDREIDPFLRSLGDRFFRNVSEAKRANQSAVPGDTQTETDVAVEKAVCDFLKGVWDIPILSEESAKEDDQTDLFKNAPAYWVCDPIDGTTYFQNLEYGEFGTLLSLVEDGVIVAAWGYLPGATKGGDILAKSVTNDDVCINDVSMRRAINHKTPQEAIGRCGISKGAHEVTAIERAAVERNKEKVGMMSRPRLTGHATFLLPQGKLDYQAFYGTHPWDFTVMAKFVTALGGQVFKFDDTQSARAYEGDMILNEHAGIGVVMPGVEYNSVIPPLFVGTRWEKTCALTPPM